MINVRLDDELLPRMSRKPQVIDGKRRDRPATSPSRLRG